MHLPIKSVSVSLISVVIISLFLGVTGVWAFPSIGDIIGSITGVKESTLKEIVDPVTKKIPLILLPQGVGSGLDSDKLDGEHGSFYAKEADLTSLSTRLIGLETKLNSVQTSGTPTTTGVTKLNSLTGDLVIIGGTGIFVLTDSSNLTISVANVPYSALNIASSIKNTDISSTAGISYPKLNLTGQIAGTDLDSNIVISTTGNLTTTGSGTITSAALLTALSGFTLASGTLTLPSGSISDSSLSTNVALLSGVQTFSGAKTFSAAVTLPTTINSVNGLIISSGAVSGGTGITSSGSIVFSGLSTTGIVHNSAAGLLSTSLVTGSDLYANIAISTTGNIITTGTGTVTSAGLLTAGNGLTLSSGALSLTSTSGNISLTLSSSATAFNVNSGLFVIDTLGSKVIIGGGTGKLDVGTIDPPYTIDGKRYATYLPSMTGVKEETSGAIRLGSSGQHEIDFTKVASGSDLWLFYQITELGSNWENLTVLLTPNFDGRVWYVKDPTNRKLTIFGGSSGEVSYRLTGPRFDYASWPNAPSDGSEGFVLPEKK